MPFAAAPKLREIVPTPSRGAYMNLKLCKLVLLAVLSGLAPTLSSALSNSGKVPILLYHSHDISGCTYATNAIIALQQDLQTLHNAGFTVVPAYWIAEWVTGARDGSTLPAKVVGITIDDGDDLNWTDQNRPDCGYTPSVATVLNNFKLANSLPWYSPHASLFVIASQVARGNIGGLSDSWWASAQTSGIMEVYNHGTDHDHSSITSQQWDPFMSVYVPVAGYGDTQWWGQDNYNRIDSYQEADYSIRKAAAYISGKIGLWPDLFAYPYGHASSYLVNTYFPTYASQHGTYAAFCLTDQYATRSSNRYCIPRFTYLSGWSSSAGFSSILSGAP